MRLLLPEKVFRTIGDILPADLKEEGIRYLLLDVDNTFMALGSTEIPTVTREFVEKCKEAELKIVLFSNNFSWRIHKYSREVNVPFYSFTLKPLPFAYWHFLRANAVDRKEVLAVGDQIFTDVLGAHLAGIRCYFLDKKHENDRLLTRWLRHLERRILKNVH